eukprot:3220457-Rhodomonas_salina.1
MNAPGPGVPGYRYTFVLARSSPTVTGNFRAGIPESLLRVGIPASNLKLGIPTQVTIVFRTFRSRNSYQRRWSVQLRNWPSGRAWSLKQQLRVRAQSHPSQYTVY